MSWENVSNQSGAEHTIRHTLGPRPESFNFNSQDWADHDSIPHPAKRARILACKRCRYRKQKCDGDGENPCSNCMRAKEECEPTEPALIKTRHRADYVKLLEQRVAHLEHLVPKSTALPFQDNVAIVQDVQSGCHSCTNLDSENSSLLPAGRSQIRGRAISQPRGEATLRLYANDVPAQTVRIQCSNSPTSPSNHPLAASSTHSESPRTTASSSTLPSSQDSQSLDSGNDGFEDRSTLKDYLNKLAVWPNSIPETVEEYLINIYFDNANIRWPFLLKQSYYTWHAAWKQASLEGRAQTLWQGFFVNMMFAVSLLLDPKSPNSVQSTSRNFYDQAVDRYLPLVLKTPDRLLHVQAHVMMAIHAIFSPSTEQIVLTVSAAVRYCVISQFHLLEAEPEPKDDRTKLEIQMRRRAFWSSYALDRLACGVFRLPYSIADDNITVPLFDNIDDSRLSEGSPISDGPLVHTSVSSTLHRERCLRIQSEILNMTARANFVSDPDALSNWRSHILAKLENWRSNLQEAADTNSKRPTDERWLQITYNLCLLFLHMPNKINVRGPAGDWALQASLQTIMIFRKFQGYKTIPHPWLGLVSQFSVGVTMLYCLWATPPKFRTDAYNAKSILGATRACSNNLTIIAERWEQAKGLLDVFELLATEVPLVEHSSIQGSPSGRSVTRIGEETVNEIREKLPAVGLIVLNRDVMGMIEQMITEDFPGDNTVVESAPLREPETDDTTCSVTAVPGIIGSIPHYFPLYSYGVDQSVGQMNGIWIEQGLEFPTTFPNYDML